jgi:alpha-beta hydrolase superfamily lysophospholipase
MNSKTLRTHKTTFEAADGLQLYERRWLPAEGVLKSSDPRSVVALVHGATEHSGRYAHLADFLNRHGYVVAAFDLRGHGRSEGRRMFAASFEQYLDDLDRFLSRLRQAWPACSLFLLGHSMGGAIATRFALMRPEKVDGLMLSGPTLQLGTDISPLKATLATLVARLLPRLPVEKLNAAHISRDEAVVRRYKADPLVFRGGIPAATAAAVIGALQRIEETEDELRVPLLLMHGTADQMADPEGSKRLYRRAGSKDKTLRLYEGYYHEVLNEPGKEQVMEDLLTWMEERSGKESRA